LARVDLEKLLKFLMKVWKVQNINTKKYYAMKEMCKIQIINKKSVNSVMNERQILTTLKNE
jgi:serine/threonine protein kinase